MSSIKEIAKKRSSLWNLSTLLYFIMVVSIIAVSIQKIATFQNLHRNIQYLIYFIVFVVLLILYIFYIVRYMRIKSKIVQLIPQTSFAEFKKHIKSSDMKKEVVLENLYLLTTLRKGDKFLKEEFYTRSIIQLSISCFIYCFIFILQFVVLEMTLDFVYRLALLIIAIIVGSYGIFALIRYFIAYKRVNIMTKENLKDIEIIVAEITRELKEKIRDELNEEDVRLEKERLEKEETKEKNKSIYDEVND
ncbi:hypothetical protein MADP07_00017 [Mycoplasma anatis]|uniref:Uncharacterized protein n=1 Tax=Mycoplasmopsis anatis TaxID=171279 RepID=A0A9Q3QDW8_9BACT|nr:hypothetical protein [Mycoplasmopsis anatis]MBW0595729.1 hypothetical protein [Mycoplasmopsis anatis]MBW0596621.1 hypothetical protein [Mycoplasmopsis anatis]MBW0597348.1 hypothetical protein [Mycoplasmopsis anatis]MBW0600531.1 hypothetical protein [Mycoplasmopsis anatis]MBW0602310.1 hypothetical protein [Mycoplasmopsis anatis]